MPQRNFGYHNRARQPTDRLSIESVGADAYIGPHGMRRHFVKRRAG